MADTAPDAPGMPQLDFTTFPNQIFWLVVTIVVLYLILSRVALPRIGSVLADRRGTITSDIAAAEEAKRKAAEAEEAYQNALAEARAEAARIVDKARAEMQQELDAQIQRAEAQISERTAQSEHRIREIRESAMDMVSEVARDTAKEVLKVFEVKADARSVTAAVNARMKQGSAQ